MPNKLLGDAAADALIVPDSDNDQPHIEILQTSRPSRAAESRLQLCPGHGPLLWFVATTHARPGL